MLRGLFITGTDTDAGKTVASAALLHRYRGLAELRYWKPIQTGVEQDGHDHNNDTAEVQRLSLCDDEGVRKDGIRLQHPISPHLAAKWSGITIELRRLIEWTDSASDAERWIVEGAGGVLVPVNDRETMADLMVMLGLPVVIAARSSLGTINHTLLTMEALRVRSLRVAGVIMIGSPNRENRKAIEHYGNTAVLGEMPRFDPLSARVLAHWAAAELDPDSLLWEFLK
jgi:dethiobiotin synthase